MKRNKMLFISIKNPLKSPTLMTGIEEKLNLKILKLIISKNVWNYKKMSVYIKITTKFKGPESSKCKSVSKKSFEQKSPLNSTLKLSMSNPNKNFQLILQTHF